MPVLRPIPVGFADVAWVLQLTGDPEEMVTTMSFGFAAQPTVTNANDLLAAFSSNFATLIAAEYTLERVHILYQLDADNQVVVDSTNGPDAMTAAGGPLPQNNAYLVRKVTELAGRRNRGRMYIPGIIEANVSATGIIQAATVTAMQAALNVFIQQIRLVADPVLIHSCSFEDPETTCVPLPPNSVESLQVDNTIATQRRRLR
jgi:hypothetical protein